MTTIPKRDVQKHAMKILDTYYPDLKGMKVNIDFKKRESPYIDTIRNGLQRLVTKDTITIRITDSLRQDPVYCIGRLFHELGHAKQIVRGDLSFKGTTYIYRGQEFPLRFRMVGYYDPKEKPGMFYRYRQDRDFWAPWEEFDSILLPISKEYANKNGYPNKNTKDDQ